MTILTTYLVREGERECVCARACVCACMRVCVHACVHVCVCVCVLEGYAVGACTRESMFLELIMVGSARGVAALSALDPSMHIVSCQCNSKFGPVIFGLAGPNPLVKTVPHPLNMLADLVLLADLVRVVQVKLFLQNTSNTALQYEYS